MDGVEMSNTKTELLKLAKALSKSGHEAISNKIASLTKSAAPTAAQAAEMADVATYIKNNVSVSDINKAKADPNQAFVYAAAPNVSWNKGGWGTKEELMIAALYFGRISGSFSDAKVLGLFPATVVDADFVKYSDLSIKQIIEKELKHSPSHLQMALKANSLSLGSHDPNKTDPNKTDPNKPWIPVQTKMTQMGATNIDGTPLASDGRWGKNTSAAWNKLTGDTTTPTVPTTLAPADALAKLTGATTAPGASQASAVSATLLEAYWKFPETDKRLTLTKRDALLKAVGLTTKESKPYSGYTPSSQAKISAAYVADLQANPNMEMVLESPKAQKPAQPQFNASDFFSADDVRMRKADGGLFYVPDPAKPNTVAPLSQRKPDFLTQREQRRMMGEIRREEKDPKKRRAYRQKISGQRKSERGLTRAERAAGKTRENKGTTGLT